MFHPNSKFNSDSGVTLVELLVVIVIIGILVSMAMMSWGTADEQFERQTASRQLKEALERARFDSVKRRADGTSQFPYAKVELRADRFLLTTYSIETNAAAVAKTTQTLLPSGVIINHYLTEVLPMTVEFNRRGETVSGTPQFRVCNVTCADPTINTSDILLVTPTGTVNLLPGNSSIPSFTNPNLTGNPADTESINNQVVIP